MTAKTKSKQPPPDLQGRLLQVAAYHQRRQYRAVLAAQPGNFDALHLYGVLRHQCGQPLEALKLISEALRRNGRAGAAHSNYASVLAALGRHQEALESCERALALVQISPTRCITAAMRWRRSAASRTRCRASAGR
jgi:tetratricopeptide (TPR) repeat protein